MIGCLHDRTLVRLVGEEGSARQRRHLRGCRRCSERHAAIARAGAVADSVLREATVRPLAVTVLGRRDALPRAVRVVAPFAAATALAAGLVFVLHAPMIRPTHDAGDVVELSLDEVAATAFTLEDSGAWLEAGADDVRWEAALDGVRVCETEDGSADPGCD